MRPRNTTLRQQYLTAATELQALEKPVTPRTLSAHLPKPYDAVRTFFNRNRDLASTIGVKINKHHSAAEYLSAKEKLLKEGTKPTARAIASEVGVDHSTVCRFFKRQRLPVQEEEFETIESPPPVEKDLPEPTWRSTVRMTRELTVQHFDPQVLRVVLNKVSPAQYIKLWDNGHLLFQIKGLSKPDSMPTRKEMSEFL